MYLTFVDAEFDGDTFFPDYERGDWREVSSRDVPKDARHAHACRIAVLERVRE
jgi:dihydrofolate reductase